MQPGHPTNTEEQDIDELESKILWHTERALPPHLRELWTRFQECVMNQAKDQGILAPVTTPPSEETNMYW